MEELLGIREQVQDWKIMIAHGEPDRLMTPRGAIIGDRSRKDNYHYLDPNQKDVKYFDKAKNYLSEEEATKSLRSLESKGNYSRLKIVRVPVAFSDGSKNCFSHKYYGYLEEYDPKNSGWGIYLPCHQQYYYDCTKDKIRNGRNFFEVAQGRHSLVAKNLGLQQNQTAYLQPFWDAAEFVAANPNRAYEDFLEDALREKDPVYCSIMAWIFCKKYSSQLELFQRQLPAIAKMV